MKRYFIIIFLLVSLQSQANMAEPVVRGTIVARPFTSQFVDVVHEDLQIIINDSFRTANYLIKYHIKSSKNGLQIPLIFYAKDLLDSFRVSIDGKELQVIDTPFEIKENADKFVDFDYLFGKQSQDVTINYDEHTQYSVNQDDLIYFETDITEGEHIITVSYTGKAWKDKWGWISKYGFRYALSPVKYWKSFGTLNVTIDGSNSPDGVLETNFGDPAEGSLKSVAKWRFNKLPVEVIMVNFTPAVSSVAEWMISIGPFGLACLIGLILMIVHIKLTSAYRKNNPDKKYSLMVIIGSFIVPLLFVIIWIYLYDFIDGIIGEHATRTHGYYFVVIFLYPFLIPFYWLILWIFDRRYKKIFKS